MKPFGFIAYTERESENIQRRFFNKGVTWKSFRKIIHNIPIGDYCTVIYNNYGFLNYCLINTRLELYDFSQHVTVINLNNKLRI